MLTCWEPVCRVVYSSGFSKLAFAVAEFGFLHLRLGLVRLGLGGGALVPRDVHPEPETVLTTVVQGFGCGKDGGTAKV